MKKLNLIIARTALVMLPLSIVAIIANVVLAETPWGMNEILWQVSWNVLALSIFTLYLLIDYDRRHEPKYEHSPKH